jgi:AhpD family alkylhydroperoxidase
MKLAKIIFTSIIMSAITITNAATLKTSSEAKLTYNDIQKSLGIVPTFMKSYPEAGISAAWEEMKNVQLSASTELTGKEKELIGLAVSAQIPCKYCVIFHTEAAKINGATDLEIKEAIAMAASTRHWSTFTSGVQYSDTDAQRDTANIVAFLKKGTKQMQPIVVTDSVTAYQDIEATLGTVPSYFRFMPQNGLVSGWKMMKSVQLNPETELSYKQKELVGLAVSAQVPCTTCTLFFTEVVKVHGASIEEMSEAIAMASITRFWSTVLNGSQINEATFKREVGQIMRYVKGQNTKRVGMIYTKTTSR